MGFLFLMSMSRLIPAALTGLALLVAPVKTDAITCDGTVCYTDNLDKMRKTDPEVRKEWHIRAMRAMYPIYQVHIGETLSGIAKKLTGDARNYAALMPLNELKRPEDLPVGELFLPEFLKGAYKEQEETYKWNKETKRYDVLGGGSLTITF